MQSQDSSTTGDDIESVADPLDIEGGDHDWKSVSNSQTAAEVIPSSVSSRETTNEAHNPPLPSPHSSQRGENIANKNSPSAPIVNPVLSPRASTRSPLPPPARDPTVAAQDQPSSLKSLKSPQKMPSKAADSVTLDDSARAGDTLALESAATAHHDPDLANYANFALQARDGQFLRFAADGAASLKAYPEGPSGNCLLQVVPSGSGMIKLKTNHGTFLSLTRDSSVKAVATGRTGFRVMSEGGKYVFTHESGKFLGVCDGKLCGFETQSADSEFEAVPGESKIVDATCLPKTPSKTPATLQLKTPPALSFADAASVVSNVSEGTDVSAIDVKSSIIPQTLHFSQVSTSKTPQSKSTASAASPAAPKPVEKKKQKVADKLAEAANADLPLAFSLQARDGQFLRFAADGAASLKAYPEGPSGNCLLQVVPSGSGMIKLKTNHGTFLSLTRDSSVKAVATGRTGFRVMSEGGKYVFTHESGKFLGVAAGQVCGLEKRQHDRPQQDLTSDFTVVTITEGASTAAQATAISAVPVAGSAAISTVPVKGRSKRAAADLQPATAANDPFAFDPDVASVADSKHIPKVARSKFSDRAQPHETAIAPTKRGGRAASSAPDAVAAAQDSDDDKPFRFPRSASARGEAIEPKLPSKPAPTSSSAAVVPDVESAPRSRRGAAAAAEPLAAAAVTSAPKRLRGKETDIPTSNTAVAQPPQQKSRSSENVAPVKAASTSGGADVPDSFALQARDGQFLRFAADGAASLKAYPEGPSGNCLLQVVPSGSGMIKLKTSHGTFLSLTRDSSVKAVATGRTGFRVMSEGGKYVFTHESGKFLGVAAGQVCGLEKRQHDRPQQDLTSDFVVVAL